MPETLLRLMILLGVGLLIWLLVWTGRRFVAQRRKLALAAAPLAVQPAGSEAWPARVHILTFSSEDCHQCRQLQTPALKRVLAEHGDAITITEIDATTESELTQRYHVLTVPTTVLLDEQG